MIRLLYIALRESTPEGNSPIVSIFDWEELTCWSRRCDQVSSRRSLLFFFLHPLLSPFEFDEGNRFSTGGYARGRKAKGHERARREYGRGRTRGTEHGRDCRVTEGLERADLESVSPPATAISPCSTSHLPHGPRGFSFSSHVSLYQFDPFQFSCGPPSLIFQGVGK